MARKVKTRTRMTAEQLFDLGEEVSAELVRGELREMAPPGAEHGVVVARLAWRLVQYVQDKDLGVVLVGDVGFQLASDPDTVRGPDLAFVRKDRIPPDGIPKGYWPGAPDLAVEVIYPSDRYEDVEERVADYLSAGTRVVWIVSPARRTVTAHRPGTPPAFLSASDVLEAEDLLPGFRVRVGELFVP